MSLFDLESYFARIGYAGAPAPNLDTLRALHALQPAAIAFENLDPLLERPVELDMSALVAKLLAQKRGGYCFELNGLFAHALEAMGFAVTRLGGRVRWMAPPDRPEGARSHMLLRVDLPEGPFLADVGFGGHLLDAPLRLVPDIEQQTAMGRWRLAADAGHFTLQLRLGEDWQDIYRFTQEPQLAADYQVANWFTATHPASLFRNNLLMERLLPGRRISLFNTKLVERNAGGEKRERNLASAEDLADVLKSKFEIDSPADVARIWTRISARP